jgi:beta-lactamase class A
MKKFILMIIVQSVFFFSLAQKTDKKLLRSIEPILQGFNGEVGVYIKSLTTGKTVAINADTIFPTASMVKVPILIGIMDKINKGELDYHQSLIFKDSLVYSEGDDLLAGLKDNTKVELSKVIMLMLTTSDNCASLWLQGIAEGVRINQLMDSIGLVHTKVNSRVPGREANRKQYGWGQTTPKEMVMMFEKIYKGTIINDSISQKMIRLLGRNYWDEEAIGEIPPTIFVASKNGAVNASRSETLLVMAKEPYLFSIITKNQKDQSWETNNEGWVLARKLSKLLFAYYNN